MAQITIRGLDPAIEREIRKIAKKNGTSLNRVVMDMVYRQTGFNNKDKRPTGDSLKKLAGGWSKKDASEFLESIKSCEQIDEDMWQ